MGNITVIVNPRSANGATARQWPRIRASVEARLGPVHIRMTGAPGHAAELALNAASAGAELVICVGGDGTLNEVINGFMTGRDRGFAVPLLGLIPRGTGCDFRRSVAVPRDVPGALDTIEAGKTRSIDLGRMTFAGPDGRTRSRYFLNVVSFGLGGEVDARVNRGRRVLGGLVSFLWATIVSVLRYRTKRVRLRVDDRYDREVTVWNVAVANGEYHGGGMQVAPGADPADGLFQITVVGELSLWGIVCNIHRLYNGTIYGVRTIERHVGGRIVASSDETVLIDMDGEQPGSLPVTIEMEPSAIPVLCG